MSGSSLDVWVVRDAPQPGPGCSPASVSGSVGGRPDGFPLNVKPDGAHDGGFIMQTHHGSCQLPPSSPSLSLEVKITSRCSAVELRCGDKPLETASPEL